MNDGDVFAEHLLANVREFFREHERAEERALIDALGAPIFVRLMVERQVNPLDIYQIRGGRTTLEDTDESYAYRLHSRITWMQGRPEPKRLV